VIDNCSKCNGRVCVDKKAKCRDHCYYDFQCSGASGKNALLTMNFYNVYFLELLFHNCTALSLFCLKKMVVTYAEARDALKSGLSVTTTAYTIATVKEVQITVMYVTKKFV
jgi:hypothetical protein